MVGVSLLALVLCCGLAWWQWERFSSANGTFQNLGYVLQWPLFGLAPAYMFWRLGKLRQREQDRAADEQAQEVPPAPPSAEVQGSGTHGSDEEDDELAAYNRYLARLNQESR